VCKFTGPGTVFIQTRNPVSCLSRLSIASEIMKLTAFIDRVWTMDKCAWGSCVSDDEGIVLEKLKRRNMNFLSSVVLFTSMAAYLRGLSLISWGLFGNGSWE
jgi:hypothetical protein